MHLKSNLKTQFLKLCLKIISIAKLLLGLVHEQNLRQLSSDLNFFIGMVDTLCFPETLIVTAQNFRYILKTFMILPPPPPGKKSFLHRTSPVF